MKLDAFAAEETRLNGIITTNTQDHDNREWEHKLTWDGLHKGKREMYEAAEDTRTRSTAGWRKRSRRRRGMVFWRLEKTVRWFDLGRRGEGDVNR